MTRALDFERQQAVSVHAGPAMEITRLASATHTRSAAGAAIHTPPAALPDLSVRHVPQAYERFLKPVLDRVLGAVLLLLLAPVLLAVVASVRLALGPGVIYTQRRIGLEGRPFTLYKFRTMHPDRRRAQRPFRGPNRRRRHKSPHDPRHTDLGRFLRAYSLDELPQLWNVVRGDLSLVGPRPELVDVVAGYQPWQHRRHEVKPGLTGPWQVSKRDDSGEMHLHVETDLRYVDRISPTTDLKLLLQTIPAIVRSPGG